MKRHNLRRYLFWGEFLFAAVNVDFDLRHPLLLDHFEGPVLSVGLDVQILPRPSDKSLGI